MHQAISTAHTYHLTNQMCGYENTATFTELITASHDMCMEVCLHNADGPELFNGNGPYLHYLKLCIKNISYYNTVPVYTEQTEFQSVNGF